MNKSYTMTKFLFLLPCLFLCFSNVYGQACDPAAFADAIAPPVIITDESECIAPATSPNGGVIDIPTGTCPEGSTLEYSIDGVNFTDVLPTYDQSNPITVTTRCVCDVNPCPDRVSINGGGRVLLDYDLQADAIQGLANIISVTVAPVGGTIITVPIEVGGVVISLNNGNGRFRIRTEIDINLVATNTFNGTFTLNRNCCPSADCEYVDGLLTGSVSNPGSVTMTSEVTTTPGVCVVACDPIAVTAATAPPVIITESECIAPATSPSGGVIDIPTGTCPEGSTLEYSTDGVNFTDVLPIYDQSNSITVTTRCVCDVSQCPDRVSINGGGRVLLDYDLLADANDGLANTVSVTVAPVGGTIITVPIEVGGTVNQIGGNGRYRIRTEIDTNLAATNSFTGTMTLTRSGGGSFICEYVDGLVIGSVSVTNTAEVTTTPGVCCNPDCGVFPANGN